jgi:hypothetical protein
MFKNFAKIVSDPKISSMVDVIVLLRNTVMGEINVIADDVIKQI